MAGKSGHAVALGTFDGLHKGHETVLNATLNFKELIPVAVTFDEPPKRHTTGAFVPMLMSAERKNIKLKEMGFEYIDILDYDGIHNLSPEEFLDMLFSKYNVKAAVCGFNYRFGKNGEGDAAFLSSYCHSHGAEAVVCPVTCVSGQTVSSTLIRELISDGNISFANMLLGEPFSFETKVVHGDERGRTIGFPTVNQELDGNLVEPKFGVYATAAVVDGAEYPAVTNIGIRPTFVLKKPLSETNIIGYEGNLYGKKITIKLLQYLRCESRFNSLDELKNAIEADKEKALKEFATYKLN